MASMKRKAVKVEQQEEEETIAEEGGQGEGSDFVVMRNLDEPKAPARNDNSNGRCTPKSGLVKTQA